MINITSKSKIAIYISTVIWSVIMMIISAMLYFDIEISNHFTYYILMELASAITLCYSISIGCACIIDYTVKKSL